MAKAAARSKGELDLSTLAPKRPNLDLKRELNEKLAPLEKQTKSRINQILREKLRKDGKRIDPILEMNTQMEKALN